MKTFLKVVIAVGIFMGTVSLVSDPPICFPGSPCPMTANSK